MWKSCFDLFSWFYPQTISRHCSQGKFLRCHSSTPSCRRGNQLSQDTNTFGDDEFFVTVVLHNETNCLVDWSNCSVDLLFERFARDVRANGDVGVSSPGLESFLVQISGNIDTFVPGYVVFKSVEALSSVSSWGKENNSIVSSISEGDPTPAFLVHDGLKFLFGNVSCRVNCSSITENNRRWFTHFSKTSEVIFNVHLETNEETLELDSFLDVEFGHEDHASCLHNQSGDFRDHEDSESFFGEVIMDLPERGAFACTWATSDSNFVDGVFSIIPERKVFDVFFKINLIEWVLKLFDAWLLR